jgi:hypothetical protein
MRIFRLVKGLLAGVCAAGMAFGQGAPAYTADGRLQRPLEYREWIYLSAGLDMSYNPIAARMDHSMFDNVFVQPSAYHAFLQTGHWPDKTVLALEVRGAGTHSALNKHGQFQSGEVMALEVHVRDAARYPGGWAFFAFDGDGPEKAIPATASCYSCHLAHAAVDTTFVQFYPTLLPIAVQKGTLSGSYLQDEGKK